MFYNLSDFDKSIDPFLRKIVNNHYKMALIYKIRSYVTPSSCLKLSESRISRYYEGFVSVPFIKGTCFGTTK